MPSLGPAAATSHRPPGEVPDPLADLTVADVLGAAPEPIFVLDRAWRFRYANAAGRRLLDPADDDLVGQTIWDRFPHAVGSLFHTEFVRALEHDVTVSFTAVSDRLGRWFDVQAVPQSAGLSVFLHDVTTLKEAERRSARLAAMNQGLQTVATSVAEGAGPEEVFALVCRQCADIVAASGSWLSRFDVGGYEVLATTSEPRADRPVPGDRLETLPGSQIERVRTGASVVVPRAASGRFADLGYRSAVLVPIRLAGGVWGCLTVAWDADHAEAPACEPLLREFGELVAVALDNATAHSELAHRAATDPLTGMANRRTLLETLDRRIAEAESRDVAVSLALIDVDHFKAVNDGHGHDVGDAVLRSIGGRLQGACRRDDLAARIGGDEFALVLLGCDARAATEVAERIRSQVERPAGEDGLPEATVSIGVCTWEPGLDREAVQRRADDALYCAKLHGRNAVRAYRAELMGGLGTPGRASALRRSRPVVVPDPCGADERRWAARLRDALDRDRFELHAQPIVATDTGEVVDHELLIRLRDHDGRLVPPDEFLPAAEEHGLIVDIDRWVTARAVACAARGMPVHFNLSGRSVGEASVLRALQGALRRTGADPRRLTIEVTETAMIDDHAQAAAFAHELQALGCRVALDDFGAGYNTFVRVKDLPADVLKIDRQFVSDLLDETASESVIKAIVAFGADVGLTVIAEGVEDGPTGRRLRDLGVRWAQGFHFGRPAPLVAA